MLKQERKNNSISWGARGPPGPLGAEVVETSLLATSAQRACGSDNSYFALILIIIKLPLRTPRTSGRGGC